MGDTGVITKEPDGKDPVAPQIRLQNRDDSCCCSFLDSLFLFMCLRSEPTPGVGADPVPKHKDKRRQRTRVGLYSAGWGDGDAAYLDSDPFGNGGGDPFSPSDHSATDTHFGTTSCDTSCDTGGGGGDGGGGGCDC